jgi:hypothetical protein
MSYKGRGKLSVHKPTAQDVLTAEPLVRGAVIPSSEFAPDIIDQICHRTLEGESLAVISSQPGMPRKSTILGWLNRDPEFMERYLDCQRVYALDGYSRMQDIADGKTVVEVEKITKNDDGEDISTFIRLPEDVQRSALRVKTIQWSLAKLLPKVFGDKVQQEHSLTGDLAKLLEGSSDAGHKLPNET